MCGVRYSGILVGVSAANMRCVVRHCVCTSCLSWVCGFIEKRAMRVGTACLLLLDITHVYTLSVGRSCDIDEVADGNYTRERQCGPEHG